MNRDLGRGSTVLVLVAASLLAPVGRSLDVSAAEDLARVRPVAATWEAQKTTAVPLTPLVLRPVNIYPGVAGAVTDIVFRSDGSLAAAGYLDRDSQRFAYAWTSPDGISWKGAQLAENTEATGITEVDEELVVIGRAADPAPALGSIWRSVDGATWKPEDAIPGARFVAIESSGEESLIVGDEVTSGAARPMLWRYASAASAGPIGTPIAASGQASAMAIATDGTVVVVGTQDGRSRVWRMPGDGAVAEIALPDAARGLAGAIVAGPAGFVLDLGGQPGSGTASEVWSSTDGITWELSDDAGIGSVVFAIAGDQVRGFARARQMAAVDVASWLSWPERELNSGSMIGASGDPDGRIAAYGWRPSGSAGSTPAVWLAWTGVRPDIAKAARVLRPIRGSISRAIATCPTAAEVAFVDSYLAIGDTISIDGFGRASGSFVTGKANDFTAPKLVCRTKDGSADLTRLQAAYYQTILMMAKIRFDRPLPWTDGSLFEWFVTAVRGIRFDSSAEYSSCCDASRVIVVASHKNLLSSMDFHTIHAAMGLLVHEARHAEGYLHDCMAMWKRKPRPPLEAWGVERALFQWLTSHVQHPRLTPQERRYPKEAALGFNATSPTCDGGRPGIPHP